MPRRSLTELADLAVSRGYRLRRRRQLRIAIPIALSVLAIIAIAWPVTQRLGDVGRITPIGPGKTESTSAPSVRRSIDSKHADPDRTYTTPVPAGPGAKTTSDHPAAAVTSPRGGRIAFVSTRDGNPEVYVMDPDGHNQRRLTNSVFDDVSPTWSPDGSRIAFASNRSGRSEIYVMRADGSGVRRVGGVPGEEAEQVVWSPDGRRFAFVSYSRGSTNSTWRVWVMNVDGSARRRATTGGDANEEEPDWSPDGRRIVYEAYTGTYGTRIYVIDVDSHTRTFLGNGHWPSWSPDGRHIAFVRVTDPSVPMTLRIMETDGSNSRTVFTSDVRSDEEWLESPSWSPTGNVITFERWPGRQSFCTMGCMGPLPPSSGTDTRALWQIGVNGTGIHRVSAAGSTYDEYDASYTR